jgi:hypothetical protein
VAACGGHDAYGDGYHMGQQTIAQGWGRALPAAQRDPNLACQDAASDTHYYRAGDNPATFTRGCVDGFKAANK